MVGDPALKGNLGVQSLLCSLQKWNCKFIWHLEMQHFPSAKDWCKGACVELILFSHLGHIVPFLQHTNCFYSGSGCLVIYQETYF